MALENLSDVAHETTNNENKEYDENNEPDFNQNVFSDIDTRVPESDNSDINTSDDVDIDSRVPDQNVDTGAEIIESDSNEVENAALDDVDSRVPDNESVLDSNANPEDSTDKADLMDTNEAQEGAKLNDESGIEANEIPRLEAKGFTLDQINTLTNKLGFTFSRIDNLLTPLSDGSLKLKCLNENLAGQRNDLGVLYKEKIISLFDIKIQGVFPEFKSVFTTQLPVDKLQSTDRTQMEYCTQELKKAIDENPDLRKQFTETQILQIMDGKKTITGYTWNHNEELGKMELVKSEQHDNSDHTGGRCVWGGGKECR